MFTLLIVDDEPIERQALRLMIHAFSADIQIVGEAENGFDALKLFREKRPDIVLMDIQMPGIDGLEVIEEIVRLGFQVKFIIVTSFSRFEYARKALKLGVKDFLLKPTSVEELHETLSSVLEEIKKQRKVIGEKLDIEAQIQDMQLLLQNDFINYIKAGVYSEEVPRLLSLLKTTPIESCVYIIQGNDLTSLISDRIVLQIRRMGYKEFHDFHDHTCIVVVINQFETRKMDHRELGDFIFNYFQSLGYYDFSVSVGSLEQQASAIPLSYHKAFLCSLQKRDSFRSTIQVFDDIKNTEIQNDQYLLDFIDKIVPSIITKDHNEIKQLLENYHNQLNSKIISDSQSLLMHYHQLIIMVKLRMSQNISAYKIRQDDLSIPSFSNREYSSIDIFNETLRIFDEIIISVGQIRDAANNPLLTKVTDYLDRHYNENLSLESLASNFQISSYYMSRIVKLATNLTFSEYVTQVRVEKSKELLKIGNVSIKEIAFHVGFSSQHYFSRIFKKYTGMTPTEYT